MPKSTRSPLLSFPFLIQAAFAVLTFGFIVYLSFYNFGPEDALVRSVLVFICHLINFYCCYNYLVPKYYEKKHYAKAFTGLFILLLLLTPLRYYIEKQFVTLPGITAPRFLGRRAILGFIFFSEVSIVVIASLLRLAVSNEQKKSRISDLEKLQLETELRFLKAQMSPHFLFNTINNIYSLVLIQSPKAPETLMRLSGLLRYLLYESHERVPVYKEANAIKEFIELYQLRTERKPDIHFSNSVEGKNIFIEPLLLLPLVENAVKYSGLGIVPAAKVEGAMSYNNGLLEIRLNNTIANPPVNTDKGGIGLVNIQKRLNLIYPGKHELRIYETENNFEVILNIKVQ